VSDILTARIWRRNLGMMNVLKDFIRIKHIMVKSFTNCRFWEGNTKISRGSWLFSISFNKTEVGLNSAYRNVYEPKPHVNLKFVALWLVKKMSLTLFPGVWLVNFLYWQTSNLYTAAWVHIHFGKQNWVRLQFCWKKC
jgi:hypothetical protein